MTVVATTDRVDKRTALMAVVDQRIEELAQARSAPELSERINAFMELQATFHRYSLRNLMLIEVQLAERGKKPTQVAGFGAWLKFNRVPHKGSGIAILAPARYKQLDDETGEERYTVRGFKVAHVFDLTDTYVIEGKEDLYRAALPTRTRVDGDYGDLLGRLLDCARAQKIRVEIGVGEPDVRGWSSGRGHIWLNNALTTGESCGTLLHELSHELCHDLERRREAKQQKHGMARLECEAEASAYCMCGYLNVPRPDAPLYLALHGITAAELRSSLETIRSVVYTVLSAVGDTDKKGE